MCFAVFLYLASKDTTFGLDFIPLFLSHVS